MKSEQGQSLVTWALVVALVVLGVFALMGVRTVDTNETCVKMKWGVVQPNPMNKGFQIINIINTKTTCYPADAVSFQTGENENKEVDYWDFWPEIKSMEGQGGRVSFDVLYTINPDEAVRIRSEVSPSIDSFNQKVVVRAVRSIVRDVAALYTADELYAVGREQYSAEIIRRLDIAITELGGELLEFTLRDVQFNPEYENAIEAQQIAEEGIQTAKFVAEQKKNEAVGVENAAQGVANAAIIAAIADAEKVGIDADAYALAAVTRAEADAKALELVAKALRSNPDLLTYEYIQKIAPNIDIMLLPNNGDFILPLPEMK